MTATRPNVVVIYADDLGYGDIGCFGSTDIRTPHLDALAARGVRLTSWYSNSPVCSPSRASLLTGRYPVHAGVQEILGGKRGTQGLPDQPTLASRLRGEGYVTGIFGKWHLGTADDYAPRARGFDHHFGFRAGCVDYYSHIFYWGQGSNPVHDLWDDDHEVFDNGRYLTEVIAEKAVAFIEEHTDEPFLCYVPFNAPHYPMHAPKEYVDRFQELPPDRRIMAAMISAMDDGVGRIMAALEDRGLTEHTIVLFASDNGPSTESRNWLNGEEIGYQGGSTGGLRGHKGSLFEGGIRVPAILAWPGHIVADTVSETPLAAMDLVPTALAACGAPAAEDADGCDILPLLADTADGGGTVDTAAGASAVDEGQASGDVVVERPAEGMEGDARRADEPPADVSGTTTGRLLFWEYGPQLAVRRGAWKLTLSPRDYLGGPFVTDSILVDLVVDPAETTDVSAENPDVAAALHDELMAWADGFGWDPTPWLG